VFPWDRRQLFEGSLTPCTFFFFPTTFAASVFIVALSSGIPEFWVSPDGAFHRRDVTDGRQGEFARRQVRRESTGNGWWGR
jgi:hypothetical protein